MTGDREQMIRLTIKLMSSFRMYFFYARPPPEFASGSSNDFTREKFVDQYASEYQPRSLKNLQFTESVHNDLSEWSESDNENNHRHQPPASSRYYNTGKLATISDRVGDGYYGEPAVKRVNHRAQRRIGKNWHTEEWDNVQRMVKSAPYYSRWGRGFRSLHRQGGFPRAERFSRQSSSSVMDKMIMVGFTRCY